MENLRKIRKENHLTQAEMAEKLNITQSAYSQYETNRTEPDIKTLIKIANILKVPIDAIVGRHWEI